MPPLHPENEFSRLYSLDGLRRVARRLFVKAKPEECDALAQRFELETLSFLEGELFLQPNEKASSLKVDGKIRASVTQKCVITGETIEQQLEDEFRILYSFIPVRQAANEVVIDFAAEDPPEEVDPNGIDFGEALVQQLAVMLDPYPKSENAVWEGRSVEVGPQEGEVERQKRAVSPFDVLQALKKD